jgi:hypothetical protein
MIYVPISVGELFDKITILSIKMMKIHDVDKLRNINLEITELNHILEENNYQAAPEFDDLYSELMATNLRGWELEEDIRIKQREGEIDAEFAAITNQTHLNNDHRMKIKREINRIYNSAIVEEKSYKE